MKRPHISRRAGQGDVPVAAADGPLVGLDLGATGVRAAVLTQHVRDGHPSVTAHGAGQVHLPAGVVVNGVVRDAARLTAALKQLWHEHHLGCRTVVLGVAHEQVLVRSLTIPNLSRDQQRKALPYQAKDIVALPIEEVVLDFCPLREPNPVTDMVDGLLVATPREPVLGAVAAVQRAGLRVARVDLSAFGVLRALSGTADSAEALVDFGAQLTTIVLHDRGVPKLVRTVARGGDQVTEHLADRMDLTFTQAEQLKSDYGLADGNAETMRHLVEALRPLLAEIRTSVGYLRSMNGSAPIERIALTGGGAHLPGLAAALSDQIGLPARMVDPMQHVRAGQLPDEAASAVAVGLAMGLPASRPARTVGAAA